MRRAALAIALLAAVPAGAVDPCATAEVTPERIVRITGYPSFFFRAFPKSDAVAYIRAGSQDTKMRGLSNYRVDLQETDDIKREMPITGVLDPVPSPDERIMTHPMNEYGGGIAFHSGDAIAADAKRRRQDGRSHSVRQPAYVDTELAGVYQSVGTLSSSADGKSASYRVVTDVRMAGTSLKMRDYRATFGPNGALTMAPSGAVLPLCENLRDGGNSMGDAAIQTPMLSKDGRRLSGVDQRTRTTKIFDVAADGSCTELLDLGIATGKADFSFDGNQIAFHVDSHDSAWEGTAFFSGVQRDATKDVMVVGLEPAAGGKLRVASTRRLTTERDRGSGSYYPSFRADGKIVYLHQDGDRFSFRVVDPNRAPALPNASGTVVGTCEPEATREFAALAALGDLWASNCRSDERTPTAREASLIPLGLDPAACRELVASKAPSGRSNVSKEALLAACPKAAPGAAAAPVVLGKDAPVIADARQVVQARCGGCHPSGGKVNLDYPSPDEARAVIERVGLGDPRNGPPRPGSPKPMPMGARLSTEELDAIYAYFIRDARRSN